MMFPKFIFVLFLTLFFFLLSYASDPLEFTSYDLTFILFLLMSTVTVEFLFARALSPYRVAQNIFISGFSVANIISAYLFVSYSFLEMPVYVIITALLMGMFVVYTLLNVIDEKPPARMAILVVAVLAVVGMIVKPLAFNTIENLIEYRSGMTSSKSIRLVDFNSTPNVYFIAFDALVPRALAKDNLDIDGSAYHEVIDAKFSTFSNLFADRVATVRSLNSFLALDMDRFGDDLDTYATRRDFFLGATPAPLFEIFKHNGYETTTLYQGSYFGPRKGKYVDYYLSTLKIGACEHEQPGIRKQILYFGYCRLIDVPYVRAILSDLNIVRDVSKSDFLLESMRAAVNRDKPQVLLGYILLPHHTPKGFDFLDDAEMDEYREDFLSNSKKTAAVISRIIEFIEKEDPGAMLYVFGDHGAFIYRYLRSNPGDEEFDAEHRRYIQDNFGVYGGLYPAERCADSLSKPYSKDFTTVSQGALMIVRCLAGGEDPVVSPLRYQIPDVSEGSSKNYEDYLYE